MPLMEPLKEPVFLSELLLVSMPVFLEIIHVMMYINLKKGNQHGHGRFLKHSVLLCKWILHHHVQVYQPFNFDVFSKMHQLLSYNNVLFWRIISCREYGQYVFQTRTEIVIPMGAGGNDTMFQASPFNLTEYKETCIEVFGIAPRPLDPNSIWWPCKFSLIFVLSVFSFWINSSFLLPVIQRRTNLWKGCLNSMSFSSIYII